MTTNDETTFGVTQSVYTELITNALSISRRKLAGLPACPSDEDIGEATMIERFGKKLEDGEAKEVTDGEQIKAENIIKEYNLRRRIESAVKRYEAASAIVAKVPLTGVVFVSFAELHFLNDPEGQLK
jgi:hypothetical protein